MRVLRPLDRPLAVVFAMSRLVSLFSFRCYERRVLLDLAALRAGLTALLSALLLDWQAPLLGAAVAVALVPCNAALVALVSADWIEHYGRLLIFGYAYNPNVSAIGELEGSMCPTDRSAEAAWRATLYTRLAPGDDPSSGHYDYPIPTLWGRVRAIWSGA